MGKKNVLIIDDNSENREILMLHLRKLPICLFEAFDGEKALIETENNCFDLILMDIQLPKISGYDLILKVRELQEDKGEDKCIIIAVTANSYKTDQDKCLGLGFDKYVTKPIRKKKIITLVCEMLNIKPE